MPVFIDGTFYCVPLGFYQLVIIMVYDAARRLYTPVWYILLDGKHEAIYRCMFDLVAAVHRKHDIPELEASQLTCGTW